jgi:glutaryl-CoA dehydrogenase
MKHKVQFQWDDPLLLDQQLTEDERMVRDAAQAYCRDKLRATCWAGTGSRMNSA